MQLEERLVLSAVGMPIELPNEMFVAAEVQLAAQTPVPRGGPGETPGVDPYAPFPPLPPPLNFESNHDLSTDDSEPASAERFAAGPTGSQLLPTTAALDSAIAVLFGSDQEGRLFADDSLDSFRELSIASTEVESDALALDAPDAGTEFTDKIDALAADQALDQGELFAESLAIVPANAEFAALDTDCVPLDVVGLFGGLAPGLPQGLSQLIAGVAAADLALAQQALDELLAMMEQLGESSGLLVQASFSVCLLTMLAAVATAYEVNRRQIGRKREGARAERQEDALPPHLLLMMASTS